VVTNARAFYTPRAAAGATGTRLSLRPLISDGGTFSKNSGDIRGEITESYLAVIASQPGAHSRDPLARNDDVLFEIRISTSLFSIPSPLVGEG
jgi:hypothetical protein